MPELSEEQKAALEKEKKEKAEKEDPFADIFGDTSKDDDDEETQDDDDEEEDDEEEDDKKSSKKKPKKKDVDINGIVNKKVSEATALIDRRSNVNDFLQGDNGRIFSKFSEQIRKAALDPRFSSIPVSQLPQLILKPEAYVKVLTDARQQAEEEAEDSVAGGSSRKSMLPDELQSIDPLSMSADEFKALKDKAKRGAFSIKAK